MHERSSYAERASRNSLRPSSLSDALAVIRSKIKTIEALRDKYDSYLHNDETIEVCEESLLIRKSQKKIRRVYLMNHRYKVGWVIDNDMDRCMLCMRLFGWLKGRLKHHCRACGALVCHDCSPYQADIPFTDEANSRVCKSCFGLKPAISAPVMMPFRSPIVVQTHKAFDSSRQSMSALESSTVFTTPPAPTRTKSVDVIGSAKSTGSMRRRSPKPDTEENRLVRYLQEMDALEQQAQPKYLEAYTSMREIIPLDIYKSNVTKLQAEGLPEITAQRIWSTKILWLIVMHKDDIRKIHLADFRGKYFYDMLDIVEMRAVWYALPDWSESENVLDKSRAEWKEGLKSKLDDLSYKEAHGTLPAHLMRHVAYEQAEWLHCYDSSAEVVSRFHRSASYKQAAIDSPLAPGQMGSTRSDDGHTSPYESMNIAQRSELYLTNFADDRSGRESKYRTLLEEINAESEDDGCIDDLLDEVSSLGIDPADFPTVVERGERGVTFSTQSVQSSDTASLGTRPKNMPLSPPRSPKGPVSIARANSLRLTPPPAALPAAQDARRPSSLRTSPVPIPSSKRTNSSHSVTSLSSANSSNSARPIPVPSFLPDTPKSVASSLPQARVYSAASSSLPASSMMDTPHTFTTVDSQRSYKFLSTSKKYNKMVDDSPSTPSMPYYATVQTPTVAAPAPAPTQVHSAPPAMISGKASSAPVQRKAKVTKDQIIGLLLAGRIDEIQALPASFTLFSSLSATEAANLAWTIFRDLSSKPDTLDSLLLLIDEGMVSCDLADKSGRSLLLRCTENNMQAAGRELISRGADILLRDQDNRSALSIALKGAIDWLLDEFQTSGHEARLLGSNDEGKKFSYFVHFILAGCAEHAQKIINTGMVSISKEDATILLNDCRGNFESMLQPMETFDLLEALGASMQFD